MASVEQILKQATRLPPKAKTLIAFILVLAAMSHCARAQTFAEWFSQKKTQKKYLLQQIAALQMYSGYLQKGYHIAKGGLGSIGNYIGNEYGLHSSYYAHLKTVSVPVSDNPQVKDILRWQQDILAQTSAIKSQQGLTVNERSYLGSVCAALLNDCDTRLNDLQTVLADQKTEMSDEERIRQIARLHAAMEDNYRFAAACSSQIKVYVLQKQQGKNEVITLNRLYEKD
ncbi:hypothetical protein PQ469_14270 [Mucilaginibacter sp. KACC 22773]|uniref:hypothetical protein n=1 Tax=Mucilaginibacter sp. KACC 22773 TaxID=3025671 RepID=UPI002364FD3F|nr:hypothetical protein [Mucilaginibacter sp. KACC 22773]WDF81173.1 hypothetical protein PQ469_14270 [Mucilaginibacter sp. KACC 22773]